MMIIDKLVYGKRRLFVDRSSRGAGSLPAIGQRIGLGADRPTDFFPVEVNRKAHKFPLSASVIENHADYKQYSSFRRQQLLKFYVGDGSLVQVRPIAAAWWPARGSPRLQGAARR